MPYGPQPTATRSDCSFTRKTKKEKQSEVQRDDVRKMNLKKNRKHWNERKIGLKSSDLTMDFWDNEFAEWNKSRLLNRRISTTIILLSLFHSSLEWSGDWPWNEIKWNKIKVTVIWMEWNCVPNNKQQNSFIIIIIIQPWLQRPVYFWWTSMQNESIDCLWDA